MMQHPFIFEPTDCRFCGKPYRPDRWEYGLTVYVPDCQHHVTISDGTATTTAGEMLKPFLRGLFQQAADALSSKTPVEEMSEAAKLGLCVAAGCAIEGVGFEIRTRNPVYLVWVDGQLRVGEERNPMVDFIRFEEGAP